jgi:hypothetical protein
MRQGYYSKLRDLSLITVCDPIMNDKLTAKSLSIMNTWRLATSIKGNFRKLETR